MNQLKQLSERLQKVANLSLFCRAYNLPYRTMQRIKAGADNATLSIVEAATKALDKWEKL